MRSSSSTVTTTGALLVAAVVLLLAAQDGHCAKLCMDSSFPRTVNGSLSFCGYNGTACCNATDDAIVGKQFAAMNISTVTPCGDLLKSILCARCNPYAGELFTVATSPRTVPLLCAAASTGYCARVWETCKDVSIPASPFQSPKGGMPAPKLTDVWQSVTDFCGALGGGGGNSSSICFDGDAPTFPTTTTTAAAPTPPNGMCLERVSNGSYINMAAHPDGSSRVFLGDQAGKVFLATVPAQGSGQPLQQLDVFLDITDEVHFDNEFGLLGLAFHPEFASNGRFFVSYSCDKTQSATCSGRCACNSDVGCDPTKIDADNGAQPCQFQSVIAEYTANASSSGSPSTASAANPRETRRIMTMGLPYTTHHGGQILFGPADGYMYFMMGDGGGVGDPWNLAQNKGSLLGKIIRIDINNMTTSGNSSSSAGGAWGNYGVPKDNPFAVDAEFAPEVFALGFKNPWRCSFDSGKPSYFYCADVGHVTYEEVDLVVKGGNYGWRVFEGNQSFLSNTSAVDAIDAIAPVMGYHHSEVNNNIGSASITGGYVYRSTTDPCLHGRYIYSDLYAQSVWAGTETPENSGVYNVTALPFSCSAKSPIPCDAAAGKKSALGYIFSFGEDNAKDVYLLTSKGVYRVVDPANCNYACPIKRSGVPPPPAASSPAVTAHGRSMLVVVGALLVLLGLSL